ncbi:PREDICTED: serine/threonine-protein phosphatase Pgam5, mitochondrial-like isoform X3 [Wasmannia auropunctata]|uniref:serine/threonine-protein phosphatase Pgam5, mitochondrial-like isoform X3 n=1 Tax=Wasmannia auropunctata TaxID=64793 RepID=UPI0005ED6033|nr:PREDICTED: serine/threonine-protein phosphatase Pgam5, mitochondrial-like isoform X3 [Wasmannia auropunctata]
MPAVSPLYKWALGLGAVGGSIIYYYSTHGNVHEPLRVHNSWTTNYTPSVKWDHNWDRRDPKSLAKPKIKDENDMSSNKYNEKFEGKAKAMRYIALIRHGQYHKNGRIDERVLTKLGRKQAEATGKRLAELNLPYSLVVRSTMTRAQETSKIIEKYLANVPVENDRLLIEGSFSPPEQMPFVCWKLEKHFSQYRPKIEAAFRKYFHRAEPSQNRDSYTVLVCHRNVIRYFVCR